MRGSSVPGVRLTTAWATEDETSAGTLTVTGTIESSISLTIESAGGTTSGTGTAATTSALGSIAKYEGTAPTGFTRTRGASDWTLSPTVGVKVVKANLTSTDYTLTATLEDAPDAGVTWKLNGLLQSDELAIIPQSDTENAAFELALVNDGAEPEMPKGVAVILNGAGAMIGRTAFEPRRLLPGERATFRTTYPGELPPGSYRVVSTFEYSGKALTRTAPLVVE